MNHKELAKQLIELAEMLVEGLRDVSRTLAGLAAEALKYDTFEAFERAYVGEIKHGKYWHITEDPDFQVDPTTGPRDMSTFAGVPTPDVGKLMITSHLEYWAAGYAEYRGYAAEIDMSAVDKDDYYQVRRGFGNEFFVKNVSKVRVIRTLSLKKALRVSRAYHRRIPDSREALQEFYDKVWS